MKKFYIIVALLLVGAGIFIAAQNNDNPKTSNTSSTSGFASLQTAVKQGAQLYDVRTPSEYTTGHFPSSLNLPLQDMQAGKLPEVHKTTKIYVYCQSGNRATQAYSILTSNGFTNVTNLGGVDAVKAMGGTLITN